MGSKVRLRGPANFLSWAQLSSAQKFWAHVGHYLLVDLLLVLDSFSLFCSSNMLKFDQFLTFEDWGNKWRSKWGNKMGMWDITTGNLNVWVTKCQGLNFILAKL